MPLKRWAFVAAAVIPAAVLLLLCGVALYEWWLISSHQIVVTPRPVPGAASVPEMPARRLLPMIVGSAALAALFAYAAVRGSPRALAGGYAALALVILLPLLRRLA